MNTLNDRIETEAIDADPEDDRVYIKGIWDPSEEYRVNGERISGDALKDAINGEPIPLRLPDGSIGGEARLSLREDGRVDVETVFKDVMDASIYARSLGPYAAHYSVSAEGGDADSLDEGIHREGGGGRA